MNLTQLQYFKALAQSQHYASTAEQLGVAQSSLSRSISALEEELGVYLFEKQGRNIRLTKYGKAYYRYVCDGLNLLETGEKYVRDMVDPNCGEINLGLIYSLGPKSCRKSSAGSPPTLKISVSASVCPRPPPPAWCRCWRTGSAT